eukprot:CAMPEP_0113482774 /NCGR_PEP_ID=MMETSP0014_2-20120614/23094_1 /TAXON_ID=2857 /ORGANISM="Nitzschia sp." /LENGTH=305 /DNA_ID=CAMNT_0000376305 /DNA_START=376 /DNA_END=1293 /DNA_ORIENTATION=- /assembly_acc=CAM_ASM_000159
MKLTIAYLALVAGVASAGRPQLSLSVQDGSFNGVDGLNPTLNWEGSANSGDVNIDYGVEADARPTTDIASLPRKVWGKASTNVAGWGVSARAERSRDSDDTNLEFGADNDDADLSLRVVASAGGGVDRVEATKGIDLDKTTRVTVNPRYSVADEEADVVVGWDNGDTQVTLTASADDQNVNVKHRLDNTNIEIDASRDSQQVTLDHQMDNTNVKLTASADNQEVTVSQQIDADNRIAPTINRNGDVSVEWERSLGDDSSLTATLKPNDSLNVEWKDNDWTANVDCGLDGANINGANVHIKRDVTF